MRRAVALGDDRVGELAAQGLVARPAERSLRREVPVQDHAVGVHRDEGVGRRFEDLSSPGFARRQRRLCELSVGDVAGRRVHELLVRGHDRAPVQPAVAAVTRSVAVHEAQRDLSFTELRHLSERRRAIVGMDHVDERLRQEPLGAPAQDLLDGGVDALEVAVGARRDHQVARELEVAICAPQLIIDRGRQASQSTPSAANAPTRGLRYGVRAQRRSRRPGRTGARVAPGSGSIPTSQPAGASPTEAPGGSVTRRRDVRRTGAPRVAPADGPGRRARSW